MSTSTKPKKEKKQKAKKPHPKASAGPRQEARAKAVVAALKSPKMQKESNSVASRVVKSIMNPSSGGMRLATINDCNPTSLVDLHVIVPVSTTTYVGNYIDFPAGVSYQALFRCPLRSMVYLLPNVSNFVYTGQFRGTGGYYLAENIDGANSGLETPLPVLYFSHTSGPTPHGAVLFCGSHNDKGGYVWMDAGNTSSLSVNLSSSVAGIVVGIRVYKFQPNGDLDFQYTNVNCALANTPYVTVYNGASLPKGGYMRITYLLSGTANITISTRVYTTAKTDVFAHISPQNALAHLPQLAQARVNATSLLLSNGAAAMYNDGFIQGVNMNSGTPWETIVGDADLSGLAADVNYFSGVFKKGAYTFLKPSDSEDLDFYPYVTLDSGQQSVTSVSFPLLRSRYALFRVQSNPYGVPATYPGLEYILNQSMVVEFQTNDMWFDAEIPQESCLEVDRARDILRKIPHFYENSSHLAALANAARNAGGFLRKHAGKIGLALSALFPKFSPVFRLLAGALRTD